MTNTLRPTTPDEALQAVAWAAAEEIPLEIVGGGSKRHLGRPVQAAHVLDMSGLSGIVNYEPAELILTALPGTPMSEIHAALDTSGQMLAFEPMDPGPLFGEEFGLGTLGGLVSANLRGPRRLTKGAARDHVLGVHAISGRGEMFKAGGHVVKNVTGYDLTKMVTGAFGTLAVMTELTMKVVPSPAEEITLVLRGLSDEIAGQAMSAAMGSPHEVAATAHLPTEIAERLVQGAMSATLIRLEGIDVSVAARSASLDKDLLAFARAELMEGVVSRALWSSVRDCAAFTDRPGAVWRISVAPLSGAPTVRRLRQDLEGCEAFYDWAGGLVWLLVPEDGDAGAEAIRRAIAFEGGGHATLYRASAATRTSVPVFEPQQPALADLSRRLKEQFDPKHILNPGRMTAGV